MDKFVSAGRNNPADEIRLDRQLTMAPIDHGQKLDACRTSPTMEGLKRGPYRTARKDHIIDKHHMAPIDGDWQIRRL